jgi:hypothetical protein
MGKWFQEQPEEFYSNSLKNGYAGSTVSNETV